MSQLVLFPVSTFLIFENIRNAPPLSTYPSSSPSRWAVAKSLVMAVYKTAKAARIVGNFRSDYQSPDSNGIIENSNDSDNGKPLITREEKEKDEDLMIQRRNQCKRLIFRPPRLLSLGSESLTRNDLDLRDRDFSELDRDIHVVLPEHFASSEDEYAQTT